MELFKKTLLILVAVFLFKLMNSCCLIFGDCCKNDPLPTSFNNIKISNVDNSKEYDVLTTSNEMKRAAVAFNVNVFDTNYYNYYSYAKSCSFGFSQAYAMECENPFAVITRINCISITTKYDINSSIKAGEEVVNHFVAKTEFWSLSGLYSTVDDVLDNQRGVIYEPWLDIRFYLKIPVENNIAQFDFQIFMSDGSVISDSTNLISIVD
ncbi:MAG: hypothetical protein F9K37_04990 [Bacteroidales bacterium]|nr:MAG: hypothetical protein F9K37_04990 [Bacteroidales bacterium]